MVVIVNQETPRGNDSKLRVVPRGNDSKLRLVPRGNDSKLPADNFTPSRFCCLERMKLRAQ